MGRRNLEDCFQRMLLMFSCISQRKERRRPSGGGRCFSGGNFEFLEGGWGGGNKARIRGFLWVGGGNFNPSYFIER